MAVYEPNRKVLIIDDDPNSLDIIREILVNEKLTVETATNGAEGLTRLETFKAGLVLLDQDMPGLTGLETLREIHLRFPGIDVMFISAHSNPRMVSMALESGADDYIRKPFSVVELVSRVHVRFRIRDLREQLRMANEKLAELTVTDELTGLYNMRSIYERIEYEIRRTQRNKNLVGVVMIDLDHFKTVNDGHDHLFGSFVIREMGEIIRKNLRDVDFAARYGGDEFLIVLTDTDEHGVKTFCERLRKQVKAQNFKEGSDEIKLTLSVGYAIASSGYTFTAKDLVRVADHSLYRAKERGRDQVAGMGPAESGQYLAEMRNRAA